MSEKTTQLLQSFFDGEVTFQQLKESVQVEQQDEAAKSQDEANEQQPNHQQLIVQDFLGRFDNTLTLFKNRVNKEINNPLLQQSSLKDTSDSIKNDITAIAATLGVPESAIRPTASFANNQIILGSLYSEGVEGKNYFAYHDGNFTNTTAIDFTSLFNLLVFVIERASRIASAEYVAQVVNGNLLNNLYVGDNIKAENCSEFYKVLDAKKGKLDNHFEATIQRVAFVDGTEVLINKPQFAALSCNNVYDLIFSLPLNGNGIILLTIITEN